MTFGYPFPIRQISDSSKFKEFADSNFKCDENGRKFSKWLENTVLKGEIAHYEQFLLLAQCFQKTYTEDTGLFGKELRADYPFITLLSKWSALMGQ